MRMVVLGTGYLGATHAACMAELGHEVLGVDIDPAKLAKLEAGEIPFFEPGLAEVFTSPHSSGRLRFSSSYEEAVDFADVFFVTVGTPQKKGEFGADLQFVDAVITAFAPLLDKPAVIVGKSTVPVGTAARLGRVARDLSPAGDAVEVAWNPEFLREGFAVKTRCILTAWFWASTSSGSGRAEHVAREIYADLTERRHSVHRDRSGNCRVGEGVGECLSGNEDFVHQCYCRGVRGGRCRCNRACGRDRIRWTDRTAVPQRRSGLWRRVPAQGHSGVHGSGGRVGSQPGADVPARSRQHQHASTDADGRDCARGVRRKSHRGEGRRARGLRSSPTRMTFGIHLP